MAKKKSGISIRDYAAATSATTRHESQSLIPQEARLPRQNDSALQMLMEERERSTLQKAIDGRPINTKRKYEGYQKEFAEWSQSMGFSDGVTVTGSKLHLFLDTQVVGRESKKKKGKVIGASTVYGYVNAVVNLYNQQVSNKMNANEHPRTYKVKQLLSSVQAETTATRKKNYTDRGVGSLLDGYQSESQFTQICDTFFVLNDLMGRAAFLVSHFGLLRGENIRDLELADMFSQELDKEGFQPCIALVLLIQHGKTNTFGKLQHVRFMRNKAVHLCPVGAVAFYLFERFHLNGEPFPSFRRSQDWYDIKFLRGKDPKNSISYNNHKKRYEAVFKHLGLTFNKKTHINRQQGVRQLESADVDVSQTRRHGRWGLDTVEAVYSAPLAREAIRALSGHPPRSRLYYLDRAIVEPPNDLQQLIFPGLESFKQKILVGEWECNLAARGFIDLLEFLRTVLLQDAAFLFDILPDRLRSHYVFGGMFQQYRAQALVSAQTTQHPVEMQLQLAMPVLSQQINTQHAATMQRLESQHLALVDMVKQSQAQLASFLYGEVLCRLLHVSTNTIDSGSIQPPLDNSSHVSIAPNTTVQQRPQQLGPTPVPQYTMSRAVSSVRELWTEWHHGIANQPSIEYAVL